MSEQNIVGLTSVKTDNSHINRHICIVMAKYINVLQIELCIIKNFFFNLRKINAHDCVASCTFVPSRYLKKPRFLMNFIDIYIPNL